MAWIRNLLAALMLVAGLGTAALAAGDWTPYSPEALAEAQNRNAIVLVDVHADWCPACKAQKPILDELRADPALENVVFVKVNFDEDKAFLKEHNVPRQATILMFKGKEELGRLVFETNRDRLREFVLGNAKS